MHAPRQLVAALVAAVVLCQPRPASADIFVAPFLGVKFRGSTNQLDLNLESGARKTKSSIGISGIVLADAGFGVELDLGHQSRFFEDEDNGIVTRSGVTTLSGNVVLALPLSVTRESLRPYVVTGLGWMHDSRNDQIDEFSQRNNYLGLTVGLGAIGFLTDVVGVRFDLRRLQSVSSANRSETSGREAQLSFWRATIGVVFR